MARYDGGYDYREGYRGPYRGRRGPRGGYDAPQGFGRARPRGRRQGPGERAGAGGYRRGFQGGSGGIRTSREVPPRYDRDLWWLGEHEYSRRPGFHRYDAAFERFDREHHPRFSPVGGMYGPMGGEYTHRRPPRELRDDTWFSDWTRWF